MFGKWWTCSFYFIAWPENRQILASDEIRHSIGQHRKSPSYWSALPTRYPIGQGWHHYTVLNGPLKKNSGLLCLFRLLEPRGVEGVPPLPRRGVAPLRLRVPDSERVLHRVPVLAAAGHPHPPLCRNSAARTGECQRRAAIGVQMSTDPKTVHM
jgi:hypothetical protein